MGVPSHYSMTPRRRFVKGGDLPTPEDSGVRNRGHIGHGSFAARPRGRGAANRSRPEDAPIFIVTSIHPALSLPCSRPSADQWHAHLPRRALTPAARPRSVSAARQRPAARPTAAPDTSPNPNVWSSTSSPVNDAPSFVKGTGSDSSSQIPDARTVRPSGPTANRLPVPPDERGEPTSWNFVVSNNNKPRAYLTYSQSIAANGTLTFYASRPTPADRPTVQRLAATTKAGHRPAAAATPQPIQTLCDQTSRPL
jgi:hypothetical protein